MIHTVMSTWLRMPDFRGKHYVDNYVRRTLRPPTYRVENGIRMELDAMEWLQSDMIRTGNSEPGTCNLIRRILRPGDTYVDVGCHVGYHALVASACVGPNGRVVAVDPQPYNCSKILTNFRINGFKNLTLFAAAVGPSAGVFKFDDQPETDKAKLSLDLAGAASRHASVVVPIMPLSDVIDQCGIGRVSLLKIDAEGFEFDILSGLQDRIADVDDVIVEVLPSDRSAEDRVVDFLIGKGFTPRNIAGEPWSNGQEQPENNLWASRLAPS